MKDKILQDLLKSLCEAAFNEGSLRRAAYGCPDVSLVISYEEAAQKAKKEQENIVREIINLKNNPTFKEANTNFLKTGIYSAIEQEAKAFEFILVQKINRLICEDIGKCIKLEWRTIDFDIEKIQCEIFGSIFVIYKNNRTQKYDIKRSGCSFYHYFDTQDDAKIYVKNWAVARIAEALGLEGSGE